jgi:diguanylate cyclase (GGDEF)-like protein
VEHCWAVAVEDPAAALGLVAKTLAGAAASPADRDADVPLAELGLCRGYAQEQLGRMDLAGADYEAAVAAAERLGDRPLLASALAQRGELAYYRGEFTRALADLDRSYRMELELGRESRQRYVLNAIANLYADARVAAYDKAIEYYRQILAAHQRSGNLGEQATAHFNLGSTLERKADWAGALAEYEQAAEIDRERNEADELAYDERTIANLLVKLGRAEEAIGRIEPVVRHYAETGDQELLAHARLTRGIARRARGDLRGALADLDAAAERFRAGGNARFLARVEEERAEALAAGGDPAGAFAARTEQARLERALAEAMRDENTSRLRVQFDTEKKEAENAALALENELRGRALADAARIRRLQRLVIALAAMLLVLVGALAVRQIAKARRMHVLAMTDELTRLPNRRAFMARAAELLALARRGREPLALLALDIDHFKRINDTHGHDAGDRVLQRVAHAARSALRPGDLMGRTGGEEFLALLPRAAMEEGAEIAERLRRAVAAIDLADVEPSLRATVSVGVARCGAEESSLDAALRRADEALYRAKQNGRNRVDAG